MSIRRKPRSAVRATSPVADANRLQLQQDIAIMRRIASNALKQTLTQAISPPPSAPAPPVSLAQLQSDEERAEQRLEQMEQTLAGDEQAETASLQDEDAATNVSLEQQRMEERLTAIQQTALSALASATEIMNAAKLPPVAAPAADPADTTAEDDRMRQATAVATDQAREAVRIAQQQVAAAVQLTNSLLSPPPVASAQPDTSPSAPSAPPPATASVPPAAEPAPPSNNDVPVAAATADAGTSASSEAPAPEASTADPATTQ